MEIVFILNYLKKINSIIMLKKIIVTGGDGRFAKNLKKLKVDINLFLEIKNN